MDCCGALSLYSLQVLTGEGGVSALTLATLVNPKPVPGETTVKSQRWYLKGSISHEVANEVVKLLKDMTNGSFGGQWQGYTKSAIGQAVLHLTKLHEDARVPVPGMYSQTVSVSYISMLYLVYLHCMHVHVVSNTNLCPLSLFCDSCGCVWLLCV